MSTAAVDELSDASTTAHRDKKAASPPPANVTIEEGGEDGAVALGGRRNEKTMRDVIGLVSKLTTAQMQNPKDTLADLMKGLGFKPDDGRESESDVDDESSDSSGSSINFSFNLVDLQSASTMSGSIVSATRAQRHGTNSSLRDGLAAFSTNLAHRCWIENNPEIGGGAGLRDAAKGPAARRGRHGARDESEPEELSLVPWRGAAAVMFIDLCGYSKIASALTRSGGAHALSAAVNAYFEQILAVVVEKFGGDVVTFAGDAVVVCWPSTHPLLSTEKAAQHDHRRCCVLAAACADELQRRCGMSPVPGTTLFFRLHIGLSFGEVESRVFLSQRVTSMQPAYHFVSGEPLAQTADVVNAAKEGEVCLTEEVKQLAAHFVQVVEREPGDYGRMYLLKFVDEDYGEALAPYGSTSGTATPQTTSSPPRAAPDVHPAVRRSATLEQSLVPPVVARKLRQGFRASHVAEMRFLCVLFIGMSGQYSVNTAEWFQEVQQILDDHRCPIVQIIQDDKGTHIIAAVNLYVTERSPASVGVLAARALMAQDTGSVVGVACGEVFCGVTGSVNASRWDITGPTCVTACRLMQEAAKGLEQRALFHSSVFAHTDDVSQLDRVAEPVSVKGAAEAVTVYELSKTSVSATAGLFAPPRSFDYTCEAVKKLGTALIQTKVQRGVALVSGPIGSGKKSLIAIAAQKALMTILVHYGSRDRRPLAVLATLADFFSFHDNAEIKQVAAQIKESQAGAKLTRTLALTQRLINLLVAAGIRFAFVVAYAHIIDSASLAWIKSVVGAEPTPGAEGRFLIFLTAYPVHAATTVAELAQDLERAIALNRVTSVCAEHQDVMADLYQRELVTVEVQYPKDAATFRAYVSDRFKLTPRAAEIWWEATGGCLALLEPMVRHLARRDMDVYQKYVPGCAAPSTLAVGAPPIKLPKEVLTQLYLPMTDDGSVHVNLRGEDYLMREINWPVVAAEVTARFTELYDALPPRLQLLARIVASLSTTTGTANPFHAFKVAEKLSSKLTFERVERDVQHLVDIFFLRRTENDGGELAASVPALQDVVVGLFTPDQDRLLKRHAFKGAWAYYTGDEVGADMELQYWPIFASFIGRLALAAGDVEKYLACIKRSWVDTLKATQDGSFPEVRARMEERLSTEWRRNGRHYPAGFYDGFEVKPLLEKLVPKEEAEMLQLAPVEPELKRLTKYHGPVALGPLGGEYLAMARNIVHAWTKVGLDNEALQRDIAVDVAAVGAATRHVERLLAAGGQVRAQAELDALAAKALPATPEAELAFLRDVVMNAAVTPLERARRFTEFHAAVVVPRAARVVSLVGSFIGKACSDCTVQSDRLRECSIVSSRMSSIKRAMQRLLVAAVPASAVHEAILDLAASGWTSPYDMLSLQGLRDAVLRSGAVSVGELRGMLWSLNVFGECISPRIDGATAEGLCQASYPSTPLR